MIVHLSLGQKQYVLNRLEQEEQRCSRCGSAGWGFGLASWRLWDTERYMVHLKCEECDAPMWYPVEGPIPT
jgi:RNase P subunit RPR2